MTRQCRLVVWTLALAGLGAAAAQDVVLRHEDSDGCGAAEVVLENRLVRVEVLTGEPPPVPSQRWRDRLLRRPAPEARPRYGTRFVGPGWIGQVTFLPTGRRWFAETSGGRENWQGIPEEFDEAVRVREVTPGVWHCLKIGVGLCQGVDRCFRGSLKLIDPGVWETIEEDLGAGGRAVTFRQTVPARDGYGYRYEKRLILRPGESRLLVERTLTNTGEKPWDTTWYTHAFWGQDGRGGYDDRCWATVPLRGATVPGLGEAAIDTRLCRIGKPPQAGYWGAVDGDILAGGWYACGTHDGAEVFLTALAETPAFYRMWTCPQTYSLEAFRLISLAPGAVDHWVETLACGAGLERLDAHDGNAGYQAVVSPDGVPGASAAVSLRMVPFREVAEGVLRLQFRGADGRERREDHPIRAAGPAAAVEVPLMSLSGALPVHLEARLEVAGAASDALATAEVARMVLAATAAVPAVRLPASGGGAGAVILGPYERRTDEGWVPTPAAGFLSEYLAAAGFKPVFVRDRDGLPAEPAAATALVACVGLRALPATVWRQLEDHVRAGGGLVVCGPITPTAFEGTDLLPLREVSSSVRVGASPRDCTREFLGAWSRRYQLEPLEEHPVLSGLPFLPTGRQDIGALQILEPSPAGRVILRYQTPAGLQPAVSTPALVLAAYGAGRVAVLASPVDWGMPSAWCLWNRLGEYHRQFFQQLGLWAAESALPGRAPAAGH